MAPAQLVTTGSDGHMWGMSGASASPVRDHESAYVDFMTFHLWPERWALVSPGGAPWHGANGWPGIVASIRRLSEIATKVGKPIVLEAFAYQRDGRAMSPDAETTLRDRFFDEIYGACHQAAADTTMAGLFPWAWSGDRRPLRPGEAWRAGEPFTGDPPDDPQGWQSIYRTDKSTLRVIKHWAERPITGA
jgi:mannan endo-1,4-beta-mannosidase